MTNVTHQEAQRLIARDEQGEELTSLEWSTLAIFHANEAVRHANNGLRWAAVSIAFAVLAILILAVGWMLT